jgi:hypothetical protein
MNLLDLILRKISVLRDICNVNCATAYNSEYEIPPSAPSKLPLVASSLRQLLIFAERSAKLLRTFAERGGGQARQLLYVASQLRTGVYPQCPVQTFGLDQSTADTRRPVMCNAQFLCYCVSPSMARRSMLNDTSLKFRAAYRYKV